MLQIRHIAEWRTIYATLKEKSIGFVPTMGYLHQGHLSLVEEAKKENDIVVLSIFVNPLQFGANEDLSTYPRDLERDAHLAEAAGVDYLFIPNEQEMYPKPLRTLVSLTKITEELCGSSRPGHFDGVAIVVSKFFHIIQPDRAYFGLKDAQQVAVIQQMVDDLNYPVQIRPCPIIREADGLAMSSRNVYLSAAEREQATILYQALQEAQQLVQIGEDNPEVLIQAMSKRIKTQPLATIEYVEIREFPSLEARNPLEGTALIALAVRFGRTRLIDNMIINLQGGNNDV